jgi:hypothetical protein
MFPHKLALIVALLGALTVAAHATLGVAGVMTAAQWQSGVAIGAVLFVVGAGRALATR